jgi:excisionase family DNA binding protein
MQTYELLTAREVAERLNIGIRTVWRWSASGELPAPLRLGKARRVVRWKAVDIESYLQRALKTTSCPPAPHGRNGSMSLATAGRRP